MMTKQLLALLLLTSSVVHALPCETKRDIYIENPQTKVWISTICPNQRLAFHSHQNPRVVISAEDGVLLVHYKSGKQETLQLHKNQPMYLDKQQGLALHQDINMGKEPLHVTVIELKA